MTLVDAFADYARVELGRKPSTISAYLWRLGYLERALGMSIEKVTVAELRAFKRTTSLSSATVKSLIVALHAFHDWGALEGHWERNGIALVRTPKEINDGPPALSAQRIRALCALCRHPLEYRLVYLGAYAGLRIGESAAVEGHMWQEGWLIFRGLKGADKREVPIHPELERVKWRVLAWPPTYASSLQKAKQRLARRVGVPFVAHQLRKSFASTLYDAGVADEVVKDLIGHAGDVTRRYAPVSRARKLEAISRLSYEEDG